MTLDLSGERKGAGEISAKIIDRMENKKPVPRNIVNIPPPNKINEFDAVIHTRYARKSASRTVLVGMQFTLHATRRTPHGTSRLVQAMYAWSVRIRFPPSRRCRDARVYGCTTTAMCMTRIHTLLQHPPLLFHGMISL